MIVGSVGKEKGALGSKSLARCRRARSCAPETVRGDTGAAGARAGTRRCLMAVATDKAVSSAGPGRGGRSLAHRLVPAPHTPALARTPRVPWCPQGQLLVPFLPTTSYPKRHVLTGVGLVTSALKREEKPATPAIPGPRSSPSPTPGTASHSLPLFQKFTERPTASALRPLTPACAVGVPSPGFGRRSLTLTAPAGLRPEPWPARGRPAPRACCRLCQEGHPAPAAKPRARAAGATHSGSPSWTA